MFIHLFIQHVLIVSIGAGAGETEIHKTDIRPELTDLTDKSKRKHSELCGKYIGTDKDNSYEEKEKFL